MEIAAERKDYDTLPDTLRLTPSPLRQLKWVLVALGAGLLTWHQIPADMTSPVEGDKLRLAVVAFYGLIILALAIQTIPSVSFLVLARQGLSVRRFGDRFEFNWLDCSAFHIAPMRGSAAFPIVVCLLNDGTELQVPVLGMPTDDLVDLLNRFRNRAISEAAH